MPLVHCGRWTHSSTAAAYERLRDHFVFEERGDVEVAKGSCIPGICSAETVADQTMADDRDRPQRNDHQFGDDADRRVRRGLPSWFGEAE